MTQILVRRERIRLPIDIDALRILLQRIALLVVNPIAVAGAIWVISLKNASLIALPFVGLFALLAGGGIALVAARMFKLTPQKTGSMYVCGAFTNIGAIGSLVCFVFLGESGFALVLIYKLFEELSYYAIGFPIAKYYSGSTKEERIRDHLKNLIRDPYILVALSSIVIGGFGFKFPGKILSILNHYKYFNKKLLDNDPRNLYCILYTKCKIQHALLARVSDISHPLIIIHFHSFHSKKMEYDFRFRPVKGFNHEKSGCRTRKFRSKGL